MTTPQRISLAKAARDVYRAINALDETVDFDPPLRELIRLRASQINGCSYCTDMHATDALAAGHDQRKLATLVTWRKSPFYDDRERAALALTETMTRLHTDGVPDEVYAQAAAQFGHEELGQLIGAIIAINAWNLVGVGCGSRPEV
jgi:AhpD family alkylhydroperoxidase